MSEEIKNGTQEQQNVNNGQQEQVPQATQPATPVPGTVATQPVAQQEAQPQKEGWLKSKGKWIAAGVATLLTGVGSAWLAYKKGKAAGIASVPQQPAQQTEPEDYSLNPNV